MSPDWDSNPNWNWTGNLSLCGITPNQLSNTSQGLLNSFWEAKEIFELDKHIYYFVITNDLK